MSEVRKDCFWHDSFKDMSARIHQCELAEPWTCPCTQDCEWFVRTTYVKVHIYNLQLKCREKSKED